MAQIGRTDPKITLGLYARALTSKRRRADRALSGAGVDVGVFVASEEVVARAAKASCLQGFL
jgi:hypothetical protein